MCSYRDAAAALLSRASVCVHRRPAGAYVCAGHLAVACDPRADIDPRYPSWYVLARVDSGAVHGAEPPSATIASSRRRDVAIARRSRGVPSAEQRAIADYLDRETARIDALIAAEASLSSSSMSASTMHRGAHRTVGCRRMPSERCLEPRRSRGSVSPRLSQALVQLTTVTSDRPATSRWMTGYPYVQALHVKAARSTSTEARTS